MDKKDFITLIEAYADAKTSQNHHLIRIMVAQMENALCQIFPEPGPEGVSEFTD